MGKRKVSKILNDINTILFPHLCFGCNARLYRGEKVLCALCRDELPITDHNYSTENAVDKAFYGRVPIKKGAAFLYFEENGVVKNLIHHLKYKGQKQIGAFLGDWFGSQLKSRKEHPKVDLVIPVPLHPKKRRKRGYNQVEDFGKKLADHLGAEFSDSILMKSRHTPTQTTKNRWHRWKFQQDEYHVERLDLLQGKRILLVDDVITTGATLESCSKALLQAPDVQVYLGAMACVA